MADSIFWGNDFLVRRQLTEWDAVTGLDKVIEGLPCVCRISATPTGTAIHASLAKTMVERASGDYYAFIEGADITAHLSVFKNQIVYEIVEAGASGDYTDSRPIHVTDIREP